MAQASFRKRERSYFERNLALVVAVLSALVSAILAGIVWFEPDISSVTHVNCCAGFIAAVIVCFGALAFAVTADRQLR